MPSHIPVSFTEQESRIWAAVFAASWLALDGPSITTKDGSKVQAIGPACRQADQAVEELARYRKLIEPRAGEARWIPR